MQGENPLFTQVRANWERLNAAWSLRSFLLRRELKDRWIKLQTRQTELITRARALDTTWPGLRIEARGEIYRRGWERLTSDLSAWHSNAQSYKGRCEGKPGVAACFQEYHRLLDEWSGIQSREGALFDEWGRAVDDGNRFYAKMESYFEDVKAWQTELIEFNRRMQNSAPGLMVASAPKPPGWTDEWKPIESAGGKVRWRDPEGNVWTWHPDPSGEHGRGGDHWDVGTPEGKQYWVDPTTGEWHEK